MLRPHVATLLFLAAAAGVCASASSAFDGKRAFDHLRQLVLIGARPSGSPAIEKSRAYLTGELKKIEVPVREQAFDAITPVGPIHMVNLIATIPGDRPERLVVGGHYDTKRFADFEFVGANDGGSSAAFLVELARVLKARKNALTIELVWLDGEEAVVEWEGSDHTYGSRHYVEAAQQDGSIKGLKAFVLVDMIGDRDLALRREGNSTGWLTDLIWEAAARRGQARHFLSSTTFIEDDHLPFLQAGVPSVDLIDLEYAAWHTRGDLVDQVSADSLQVVGDVLMEALPSIEAKLTSSR